MRRLSVSLLVALPLVLAGCSGKPKSASNQTPAQAPTESAPDQTTQPPARGPKVLVTKLPAGAEGVELAEGGLKVLKGYEFVPGSDSTLVTVRMSDGKDTGTHVSCRCSSGTGDCRPVDQGGIAVCQPSGDGTSCTLALTVGGVSTGILMY